MVWEASHIYAPASPAVLEVFCGTPPLASAVHVIDRLDGVLWDASGGQPYPLPETGLLVVREVVSSERRPLRWTGEETVSWQNVRGPDDLSVITVDSLGETTYLSYLYAPPAPFLRFLKSTSMRCASVVVFYHHNTFNGLTEEEFAWVFDPAGQDWLYVRTGETLVAVHTGARYEVLSRASVLALVLRDLGVLLEDVAAPPAFPPHRLSFPWSRYRYDCGGAVSATAASVEDNANG